MVFILAVVFTGSYVLLFCFFILGLFRLKHRRLQGELPSVSVIVAARNEEQTIHRCLESLANLDYPADKLEVILVDDQSIDRTHDVMLRFLDRHPNFKVLKVATPTGSDDGPGQRQTDHLRGKANAIALGIDHAVGDLIFLTDADCVVPPSWVRAVVQEYSNEIGLVASYTLLESKDFFGGMQSLDWAFLHTLAAAGVGHKKPFSCFGNNLTFRRQAYNEVGGYRNIPFSVTEDFALFTAITRKTKWKYTYLISPESLVMSLPCRTIKELIEQKQRWVVGGLDMKLKGLLLMGLGFTVNVLLLAVAFVGLPLLSVLSVWVLKVIADAALLAIPLRRLRSLSFLKFFPAFEIYYFLYLLTLPLFAFSGRKVTWKGREF
jgi:cellulose synthase/poly-beta-1,6-N-acetylglucosamine synthase-like glycosyltransferase